jgi:hypothetical protein
LLIASTALQDNEKIATDLVASQLAQGIKSDGSKADYPYSPLTIAIKKTRSGLSSVTSHLTNYDTGESYKKLFMKVDKSNVLFGTNTDKEESISDRMDGLAFKPTQDNKEELIRQHVQRSFIEKIKKALSNG